MLQVHDTLVGGKVELLSREAGRISMYVCGPTVYDVPHVGHARSALVYDVFRRYLVWRGFDVVHVCNVTDVDDKIIARANNEGITEAEVAARYESIYQDQMDRLGVLRPHYAPHATEYIDEMLDLIERLMTTGKAYTVDEGEGSSVYFAVDAFEGYGALSHRRIHDLLEGAGARVKVDERKRSPVDFVLWKAAKPSEPSWDSPWGRGRPGWHIECSAMSVRLLGQGFDVHGGGDDLVFPHHENERAQSEAAGDTFARYWMHHGMVVVGGEKMSKSLGNFTTLGEALDTFDPRAIRLLVLQTHYRSPMEMGSDHVRDAGSALSRLDGFVRRMRAAGIDPVPDESAPDESAPDALDVCDAATVDAFRIAMDDDLNTPAAIGTVFEAVRAANHALDAGNRERAALLTSTVIELAGAMGLVLGESGDADIDIDDSDGAEIEQLVTRREVARQEHDFVEADRIRAELTMRGIVIEDTPTGTIWRR